MVNLGALTLFLMRDFFAGVTILLSLTVFMNMVQTIMPSTSDSMPLIGFFVLPIVLPQESQKQLNWTFPRAFISSPAELGFNPTSLLPQPLKNVAYTQCFFEVFKSGCDLSCMYKLFLKPGFL